MDVVVEVGPDTGIAGGTAAAQVPERLQQRHRTRAEDAERRKEAKETQSIAEEKSQYFYDTFNAERASIEELLSSCTGADRAVLSRRLEEAAAKTLQLQRFVNDSVLFLPLYDLRQAQAALQKLQASLAALREEGLPKKKFAFRARTAKAPDVAPASDTPSPSSSSGPGTPAGPGSTKVDGAAPPEQCGFSNVDDEHLTKTAEEIQKRDVLLTHLTNCKVRLYGSPSTLHLRNIDGCEILCGPVSSSVFVDQCRNSTLVFPCQQLRTHNTKDTRVYLHVTSRAIIEDCHGVSFAPLSWSYPTLEKDFAISGLDRGRNNWSQVDDFNWLAAGTPSPNWSIIPEADRKTTWDP